jgi:hypothetical protein
MLTVLGKVSLKLIVNFLRRRRVSRTTGQGKGDGCGQQGFHLEML